MTTNGNEIQLSGPRLPYHPAIEERYAIDKSGWKALTEAVFPNAQKTESVILALGYCKARNLDPFKKCIHIVPIWDNKKKCYVDTVWPGIGELRTTAFRTKNYAGRDATVFGPDITKGFRSENTAYEVTYPEYAQVTVYRIVCGQRVAFAGPPVFWEEAYASDRHGCPNSMWRKRPKGQIDKCAEAAALRCAFPEEIGDEFTADEGAMIYQHSHQPTQEALEVPAGNEGLRKILDVQKAAVEPPAEETPVDEEPAEEDPEKMPWDDEPDMPNFDEPEQTDGPEPEQMDGPEPTAVECKNGHVYQQADLMPKKSSRKSADGTYRVKYLCPKCLVEVKI